TTIIADICAGEFYTLPDGSIADTTGEYETILIATDGSDSLVTTILTVHPTYILSVDDIVCAGDTYILPDGSSTTAAGSYTFDLLTTAGCDSILTINLEVLAPVYATLVDSFCTGGTYLLPDGIIVNTPGSYTATIISAAGCDSIISVELTYTDLITLNIDEEICTGEEFILPDGTAVSEAGLYPVLITPVTGCDTLINTNLTVFPLPAITFIAVEGICVNETYALTATPAGGTFSGAGVSGDSFMGSSVGIYEITYSYTDANGCVNNETASIIVTENYLELGPDNYIQQGDSVYIDGYTEGITINWSPSTGLSCTECLQTIASPVQTTTYMGISVDEYGCEATDYITIFVDNISDAPIYVPNTFTPNGDGANDYFFVYGTEIDVINYMRIYDRWGELLFEINNVSIGDFTKGWNGTARGYQLLPGVYAYTISVQLKFDIEKTFAGSVMLLR
ncbi:MAG: gliding motility-associated C-terminal domain-containing protein, partial [Chitinophagales bacterium]|nr:gliding motility-associated C-terminal domain-containing protein [Chitinophagales bacterium]